MTEPTPDQAIRNLGMEVYRQAARANEAESERDQILRIVSDWIGWVENGGVDTNNLIWELEQAGYTLPEPTTGEAQ